MIKPYYQDEYATLYLAIAEEVLPHLEPIGLIVTDPPYFRVKRETWDNQWNNSGKFLEWIGKFCDEFQRLLLPNGSLYCFASPEMTHGVEGEIRKRFKVLNNIRWVKAAGWHNKAEKESLREFLSPYESIIFAEHGNQNLNPIANKLKKARLDSGLTCDYIEKQLGYLDNKGRGSRLFYRWETGDSLPTQKDFCSAMAVCNANYSSENYEILRMEYEDLRRPFTLSPTVPFTDTWNYATVSAFTQKHPCEKPLPLMRHILQASGKKGVTVLDPFAGVGSTLVAAKELGMRAIGVEISEKYCEIAARRLAQGVLNFEPEFVSYRYHTDGLARTRVEVGEVSE